MSRICDICGKGPLAGHVVARRGTPKKRGGTGSRVLKRTKRRQFPNLRTVRIVSGGLARKVRVCAKCLKAGRVARWRV